MLYHLEPLSLDCRLAYFKIKISKNNKLILNGSNKGPIKIQLNEKNNIMLTTIVEELWQRQYPQDTEEIVNQFLEKYEGISLEKKLSDFEENKSAKQWAVLLDQFVMNIGNFSKVTVKKLHGRWSESLSELGYNSQPLVPPVVTTESGILSDVLVQDADGKFKPSEELNAAMEQKAAEIINKNISDQLPLIVEQICIGFKEKHKKEIPKEIREVISEFFEKELGSVILEASLKGEDKREDALEILLKEKFSKNKKLFKLFSSNNLDTSMFAKDIEKSKNSEVTSVSEAVRFSSRQKRMFDEQTKRKQRQVETN